MRYHDVREARFLFRPNRFIAHVELDGKEEVVHVKNTGRCRELLTPGARVWLAEGKNPDRKTRWDLIAVQKGDRLINMDSQAPNQVAREWLEAGGLFPRADRIQPESRRIRFDQRAADLQHLFHIYFGRGQRNFSENLSVKFRVGCLEVQTIV